MMNLWHQKVFGVFLGLVLAFSLQPAASAQAAGEIAQSGAAAGSPAAAATGDVSGDVVVSVADYTLLRLHLLGKKTLTGAYLTAGDMDGSGTLAVNDYVRLRLHILRVADSGSGSLPLKGYIIGLDPGHQVKGNSSLEPSAPGSSAMIRKVSVGTQGRFTRVPEYVVNLQVGLKLKAKLEKLGAKVVMTRTTHDVDISNAQRAQMMNAAMVDCWLRIHADGNDNPAVHGVSMLAPARGTMNTTDSSVQAVSVELANALLAPVIAATGAKNNGVVLRSDQTGFNWSAVPVCTIEMGYMTNEREDRLLVTDDYQNKIVSALSESFVNYFKQGA